VSPWVPWPPTAGLPTARTLPPGLQLTTPGNRCLHTPAQSPRSCRCACTIPFFTLPVLRAGLPAKYPETLMHSSQCRLSSILIPDSTPDSIWNALVHCAHCAPLLWAMASTLALVLTCAALHSGRNFSRLISNSIDAVRQAFGSSRALRIHLSASSSSMVSQRRRLFRPPFLPNSSIRE